MTTLAEAKAVIKEVDDFTQKLIDDKCCFCKEFRTLDNFECFCEDVLTVLDTHNTSSGYQNEVAEIWNRKQRNWLRYNGGG